PDLPMPEDAERPRGQAPSPGLLASLACFGVNAEFVADGLHVSVVPGVDTRWICLLTRDAVKVPVRIALVVKPITDLRLFFGAHNWSLAFDERGGVRDTTPWFMKSDGEKGEPRDTEAPAIAAGDWTHVVLEIDETARRLFVDGRVRPTWEGDFVGIRSRVGIG